MDFAVCGIFGGSLREIMKKATITDIARKSGLSTATVDRVLNDRGGVSAANRQRVLRAAKELGYLPSEGMLALPSRPAHLEFFIPFGHNSFMQDVARKITAFASSLPLVASCNVTALDGIDPDALVTALEDLPLQTNGVGVITVDHPKTRHAIRRLCESGVRVVTIVRTFSRPHAPRSSASITWWRAEPRR
ncbi:LacI family DNA-binding transcriptional regulator [Rhizobium sp. MHM7A]|uniref:LacI family DNA-binding transcriptional regulator n=1 Tax=Rhizobium sp. MHM7A TaxID=2583233 RepID=UPI001FEDD026|nr:LacI family DNA-binding transcriptional regulator [Rhizobium sp. MHM7A]